MGKHLLSVLLLVFMSQAFLAVPTDQVDNLELLVANQAKDNQ